MISIPNKAWKELVAFFRAEEKIFRDSYGIPRKKREWLKEYRRMCPTAARQYERARDAIKSAKNASEKRNDPS